jgi:RecA-family ATPase
VATGSVTVLSHPSLTGISSGSGISGSTAWHGAFRFRQYLKGVTTEAGEPPDGDLRELEFKKNQYGPTAETIALRYERGLFLPVGGVGTLDKLAAERKADELFVSLLAKFNKRNEIISSKIGAHMFAPTVFAKEAEAKAAGIKKKDFEAAMGRLFDANKIHLESYGSPSRETKKLVPGSKA